MKTANNGPARLKTGRKVFAPYIVISVRTIIDATDGRVLDDGTEGDIRMGLISQKSEAKQLVALLPEEASWGKCKKVRSRASQHESVKP